MTGPRSILVNSSSATNGRNWETEEHHVYGLNRTHWDLVKFSNHDADYDRVLVILKTMATAAISTIRSNHPGTRSEADNQNYELARNFSSVSINSDLSSAMLGETSHLQFCM